MKIRHALAGFVCLLFPLLPADPQTKTTTPPPPRRVAFSVSLSMPIPDVLVTVDGQYSKNTNRLGKIGSWTLTFPAQTRSVKVRWEHPLFEPDSQTVTFRRNQKQVALDNLRLVPKERDVSVAVFDTVDGQERFPVESASILWNGYPLAKTDESGRAKARARIAPFDNITVQLPPLFEPMGPSEFKIRLEETDIERICAVRTRPVRVTLTLLPPAEAPNIGPSDCFPHLAVDPGSSLHAIGDSSIGWEIRSLLPGRTVAMKMEPFRFEDVGLKGDSASVRIDAQNTAYAASVTLRAAALFARMSLSTDRKIAFADVADSSTGKTAEFRLPADVETVYYIDGHVPGVESPDLIRTGTYPVHLVPSPLFVPRDTVITLEPRTNFKGEYSFEEDTVESFGQPDPERTRLRWLQFETTSFPVTRRFGVLSYSVRVQKMVVPDRVELWSEDFEEPAPELPVLKNLPKDSAGPDTLQKTGVGSDSLSPIKPDSLPTLPDSLSLTNPDTSSAAVSALPPDSSATRSDSSRTPPPKNIAAVEEHGIPVPISMATSSEASCLIKLDTIPLWENHARYRWTAVVHDAFGDSLSADRKSFLYDYTWFVRLDRIEGMYEAIQIPDELADGAWTYPNETQSESESGRFGSRFRSTISFENLRLQMFPDTYFSVGSVIEWYPLILSKGGLLLGPRIGLEITPNISIDSRFLIGVYGEKVRYATPWIARHETVARVTLPWFDLHTGLLWFEQRFLDLHEEVNSYRSYGFRVGTNVFVPSKVTRFVSSRFPKTAIGYGYSEYFNYGMTVHSVVLTMIF